MEVSEYGASHGKDNESKVTFKLVKVYFSLFVGSSMFHRKNEPETDDILLISYQYWI